LLVLTMLITFSFIFLFLLILAVLISVDFFFASAPISGATVAGLVYEYCFHEGGYKVDMLIDQYIVKKEK